MTIGYKLPNACDRRGSDWEEEEEEEEEEGLFKADAVNEEDEEASSP